jgi:hypothetical protein
LIGLGLANSAIERPPGRFLIGINPRLANLNATDIFPKRPAIANEGDRAITDGELGIPDAVRACCCCFHAPTIAILCVHINTIPHLLFFL